MADLRKLAELDDEARSLAVEPAIFGLVGTEPVYIGDKQPTRLRHWHHVNCIMAGPGGGGPQTPVAVALTRAGLAGGDRLYPDEALDLHGPGVWLLGPRDGQAALVQVERRYAATHRTESILGKLNAITSWKATGIGFDVEPGRWHTPWGNIIGHVFGELRVIGPHEIHRKRGLTGELEIVRPAVWIGTHAPSVEPPPPSEEKMKTWGGAYPIFPGDPPRFWPGNPNLFVCAYEPGLRLHLIKFAGGRQFDVPAPKTEPAPLP